MFKWRRRYSPEKISLSHHETSRPESGRSRASEKAAAKGSYVILFLCSFSSFSRDTIYLTQHFIFQVTPASSAKIPEAGSETLSFEQFDEVSQRTRDLVSLSDHLYCPEGHVPGTRTSVRIITNSARLAPDLLAYLERAPRKDPPESLPITAYILEGTEENFAGYAIEEIEVTPKSKDDEKEWSTGWSPDVPVKEAKSVAAVVVAGPKPDIALIVAGIEASQKALKQDELERESKKKMSAEA